MTSVTCAQVPFSLRLGRNFLGELPIPSAGTGKAAAGVSARPFIHSLNILLKYVRLYGFDHRRTETQFRLTWKELQEAVKVHQGALVLGISENRLLLDGVPIDTGQAERSFAQLLNAAGLASIQFSSEVTEDEFEMLVKAFCFHGSNVKDFAGQIKTAFAGNNGAIRINEVKFVAADAATASVTAAAQLAAQSLGPEFKEWLHDPHKLIQLLAAAEGSKSGAAPAVPAASTTPGGVTAAPAIDPNSPLNDKEIIQALRLLTKFGELGADPAPKPELIGLELHHSDDKIKANVVALLEQLSGPENGSETDQPLLMKAAERMAIRYAMERFDRGEVKVNAVHELLEQMSQQMSHLRRILHVHEEKMVKHGILVESHADILDRMFWEELPETSKKNTLLSEDAACVPPRNVRQYVEILLERGDYETASAVLGVYADAATSAEADYRSRAANGLAQLADLYDAVGGSVMSETMQKLGEAMVGESDPEVEALLNAAFVRLSSEAHDQKHYRAVVQACDAMEAVGKQRPGLEKELRSRTGVENRLIEFIEDALRQAQFNSDLVGILKRNMRPAAEHLAERFFRSMRREECDRIVDLVHELGTEANQYLRDLLLSGAQRQSVSSVGLLSRLDVPGLLEVLPLKLPHWNRYYHDLVVRQIAYGAAPDRGRTLLEILEILDPGVVPQALDEIGMSGDRTAAPPLIVMAQVGESHGRSPLLQLKAVEALGRLRETDAIPVLKGLFEAKRMFKWVHHRELRIAAAQALAKIDPRFATQIVAGSGLQPGELALGPLDSAPACPWVRQRRYERIVLKKPVSAVISSSWGKSGLSIREMSLGGGMGTKEDSLRIGSEADIDMTIGVRHVRAQVLLRRARVNEVGFEFVNIDLEGRHRLRHLLIDSLEHAPEGRSKEWNYERKV